MLKILQARLQQYVNCELPGVQAGFRKGRRTRDQVANIHWIIEKAREFQKNIYFCFIDYAKAFDCVQFSSVAQSCPTLCDPVNRSTPRPPCPSPTPRVFLALCYAFKSKNTLPILGPKGFLKCFSLKVL